MKKRMITLLFTAAVTAAVTACGSGKPSSPSEGGTAASQETPQNVVELEGKTEEEGSQEIKQGGNIVIAVSADPQNVNPLYVIDQTSFNIQQALYSPFFEVVGGEMYYGNGLCESVETNDACDEFTLKLKPDLKWHDGEPLTADDVVFTMDVLVDKNQNVPYSSYGYVNGEPVKAEKVDDLTVKLTLASPSAGFLGGLSQVYCIPKHIYEGVENIGKSELNNNPVGSGPFKFAEYKSGEYFKVARFDEWMDTVNLDGITFKIVKDSTSANAALANGDISARLINTDDYATVSAYPNVTIYSYNSGRVDAMFMNENIEVMKDERVRQAIAYALDKKELCSFAFTNEQFADPAYSIFTPDTLYYTDEMTKMDNDVEKAKALLKEAGQSDLKLKLLYISTDKTMENQAVYIQSKLQEAGITVELNPMDESSFKNKTKEMDSAEYELILSYYTLGEEPSLYADMIYSSKRTNYSRVNDKELDALWDQANMTADDDARKEIYRQIQTKINDSAYIYPIAYSKGFYAVDNQFKGFDKCLLKTIYYDYSKIYSAE
ncbi:ABC transporter substrate-binding protein [Clostridium sp. AM58-1XD]|uniref:ABC transporter substrate-binding protein n=1 Tax=Clostridium sp. AM58-1XD TaxID=2292307 RepID=UPI000E50F8AA|nr:ABC transporter substrate-binding protein [Clostridium sp. AM58-1XD]RGZ01822.1 ABC transporter substrate-binding protein [Clostridium sp. AM58-1XD]